MKQIKGIFLEGESRSYFRLKQPDFQMLPLMTYFFQKFILSKQGGGHIRGALRVLASVNSGWWLVNVLFPIESYKFFPNRVSPTDKTTCIKVDSKHFSIISPVN